VISGVFRSIVPTLSTPLKREGEQGGSLS
jgi:hypothetical protein